jgi:hypothetical protein
MDYAKDHQSFNCDCLLFGNSSSSSSPSFPCPPPNQTKQHDASDCFVDLDDTLYPFASGIAADIATNIKGNQLTSLE